MSKQEMIDATGRLLKNCSISTVRAVYKVVASLCQGERNGRIKAKNKSVN